MTPSQLRVTGERLFGPQWQTALARSLGLSDRHVRRLVAGKSPVSDSLAREIAALDAQDEWIVGDGAESRREYMVHTKYPRFIARVVALDDPRDADADISGLSLSVGGWTDLREIIWIDPPPDTDGLADLAARAHAALVAIDLDDAAENGEKKP